MSRDEEEDLPKRKKKRGKLFSTPRIMLIVLIIGIVLGAALQYYAIDPILEPARIEQLKLCKTQNELLNQENENCLAQLYDLNSGASCPV